MKKIEKKKEDKRVKYTKIFLKESLLKLMKEKRVDKITPTELCREADINRNTFYTHFGTVRDVLEMIETELEEYIFSKLRFDQPMEKVLSELLTQIEKVNDVVQVMISPNGDLLFMQRLYKKLESAVIEEFKTRKINLESQLYHYAFSYVFFGCVAVLRCWFDDNMKQSVSTITELIMDLTNKGIEAYNPNLIKNARHK